MLVVSATAWGAPKDSGGSTAKYQVLDISRKCGNTPGAQSVVESINITNSYGGDTVVLHPNTYILLSGSVVYKDPGDEVINDGCGEFTTTDLSKSNGRFQ